MIGQYDVDGTCLMMLMALARHEGCVIKIWQPWWIPKYGGKVSCLMCHIFIDMNMSVKELCFLLVEQKIDIYLLEKRIILASEVIIPSVQPWLSPLWSTAAMISSYFMTFIHIIVYQYRDHLNNYSDYLDKNSTTIWIKIVTILIHNYGWIS